MNQPKNPYYSQANHMCSILVREILNSETWVDMQQAVDAIIIVRFRAKDHIAEWEHLNNPSTGGCCQKEDK